MNLFWSAAVLGRCNVQPPMIPVKAGLLATLDAAAPEDGRAPVQGFNARMNRENLSPSAPVKRGEGETLAAFGRIQPCGLESEKRQSSAAVAGRLKLHKARRNVCASSSGVSTMGLAFMLLALADLATMSATCSSRMP
jgi:hypothetical protein